MRRVRALAIAAAVFAASTPAQPDVALPAVFQLLGSVTAAARPVSNALVIALNLSSFDAMQTYTTADGSFTLPSLPSGVYKIIAVKQGFVPATSTLVPTRSDHRVNLRLETEKRAAGKSAAQEIWEIRASLPADILREVDQVLARPMEVAAAAYEVPRLKGEMLSMTAFPQQAAAPAFAQTAVGVQSRIGESWQLGIRGDLRRIDDPTDSATFGNSLAEARTMQMEFQSSPTNSYRVASTMSSWRYRDDGEVPAQRQAALRSHDFQWEHGDARVQVRYLVHDNLSRSAQYASDAIEIGGDTSVLQTRRNDVNVSIRVRQESVRSLNMDPLRTANLAANATLAVAPSFSIQYGVASRLAAAQAEWAPRAGVEWKLTDRTAVMASAAYKVVNSSQLSALQPGAVIWADEYSALPRYSYSFALMSRRDEKNRLSATATVSAADSPIRVVFSDGDQQFWDGLYVDAGDVRRDLRIAYRRDFGTLLAVDISANAGSASPQVSTENSTRKVYMAGDLQTIFTPTRTTLAVSYREIQQPQVQNADYRSSRVNVRMAQSLYLPVDVKLLLGMEMGRAVNSPFLLDTLLPSDTSRKYIGGLAVNF